MPSRPEWVVTFSRVAQSSADGHGEEIEGRSPLGDPSYQIAVRRMGPFGLRSRPPVGVEAVVVHANGSPSAGVLVAAESAGYGPADLEEGEAGLYNSAPGCLIRLWADGHISIDAAAGQDVVVNGGALAVARETDPVAVTIPIGAVLVDSPGGPIPNPAPIGLAGTITAGAPRFRG